MSDAEHLMGFVVWGDGNLYEKQGEECKNCTLNHSHQYLVEDKRHRKEKWHEVQCHQEKHLTRKNVSKEPEWERDESRNLTHELYDTDKKADNRLKINKFATVLQETERCNASKFNGNKDYDSEREREV